MSIESMQQNNYMGKVDLVKYLFDPDKIEMITYVSDSEILKISQIKTVIEHENNSRVSQGISKNIFADFIDKTLLLRTSRKGWRSEQAVEIIRDILNEDKGGLGGATKRIFGI